MKLVLLLLFIPSLALATWMRVEPFAQSGKTETFVYQIYCADGGFTCQDIADTSLIRFNQSTNQIEVDPVKLAAQQAEQADLAAKQSAIQAAQSRLEAIDISKVTTISGLKAIVQDLILERGKK